MPKIQEIVLYNTTAAAPPPAPLLRGEPALGVEPARTRMWVGDGANNRLVFTSDPLDPLGPGLGAANYLPLSGGQMTGAIELLPPVNGPDATNKTYVDTLFTSATAYQGTWQVAANVPNITAGGTAAGMFYIAVTANPAVPENAPGGIPGIGGQSIANGDWIIWTTATNVWQVVAGGPLTQQIANSLYVALAGGTMTGPLVLNANPTLGPQAANKAYVDAQLGAYLPLSGGVMAGGISMPGTYTPAADPDVATKAYVDAEVGGAITSVVTDGTYITGDGTSGDPITLTLVDGGTF